MRTTSPANRLIALRRTLRLALLLGAATLVIGCSSDGAATADDIPAATEATDGGDEDASTSPPEEDSTTSAPAATGGRTVLLGSAGQEPRVQLAAQPGTETVVLVTAEEHISTTSNSTSSNSTSSNSVEEDQTFSGDYDLTLATKEYAEGFQLAVERTVRSLTTDTLEAELSEIAGYVHNYSSNGLPNLGRRTQETQYSHATRGLLVTPNMILVVPEDPVGPGAEWTIPLDRSGELRAQVTVINITDDLVETELIFENTNEQGSFTMTATGAYDRDTLVAVDVTTESIVRVKAEVSNNGELVEVESEQRSTRTYESAPS